MWQKLSKCYPPIFELVPIIILALTFYMAISNYSTLPDRLPINFNILGVPEGWTSKNGVFLYPGLSVFTYLLFTILNILLANAKNPMSLINIPKEWKESLNATQIEVLRVLLNRYLFMLKIVIQSLVIYLLYISIQIAFTRANNLGVPFFFLILAILAIVILVLWNSYRIAKKPHQDAT